MATIINTPGTTESSDSGAGVIVAVVVALLLIVLFFVYALPALQRTNNTPDSNGTNINVQLPDGSNSGGTTGGTNSNNPY